MPQSIAITTAHNVSIDYEVANLGDRIVAYIIDTLLKVAYAFLGFLMLLPQFSNDNFQLLFSIGAILMLPIILYSLLFEIFNDGQTPGKRLMKIKVVSLDGTEVSVGSYFLRWVFRIVDINLLSGIIAVLTIAFSEKGQRLGDIVANTSVISLKDKAKLSDTAFKRVNDNYEPKYPGVTRLTTEDIATIKEVLENKSKNAYVLKTRLSSKLEEVLGVSKEATSEVFLSQVIDDFNYYEQSE